MLTVAALSGGPYGLEGSPTRVGTVRLLDQLRRGTILDGPLDPQVAEAVSC